jgi:ketosteroid isomerase-like protein
MLGDRLLSDVEVLSDFVDRAWLIADQAQNRASAWLGERLEGGIAHGRQGSTRTSVDLYKCRLIRYTSLSLYKRQAPKLIATQAEREPMSAHDTLAVTRAYHDAWTTKDFAAATALLANTLVVEVPINSYPTSESFAAALASFGSTVSKVDLLAAMSDGNEAMLLYDMNADGLGSLRVAEHFTVKDGRITRIRQIHDTAVVRAAALGG